MEHRRPLVHFSHRCVLCKRLLSWTLAQRWFCWLALGLEMLMCLLIIRSESPCPSSAFLPRVHSLSSTFLSLMCLCRLMLCCTALHKMCNSNNVYMCKEHHVTSPDVRLRLHASSSSSTMIIAHSPPTPPFKSLSVTVHMSWGINPFLNSITIDHHLNSKSLDLCCFSVALWSGWHEIQRIENRLCRSFPRRWDRLLLNEFHSSFE